MLMQEAFIINKDMTAKYKMEFNDDVFNLLVRGLNHLPHGEVREFIDNMYAMKEKVEKQEIAVAEEV